MNELAELPLAPLSRGEQKVLRMLVENISSEEMGVRLQCTVRTVEVVRFIVRKKFGGLKWDDFMTIAAEYVRSHPELAMPD